MDTFPCAPKWPRIASDYTFRGFTASRHAAAQGLESKNAFSSQIGDAGPYSTSFPQATATDLFPTTIAGLTM
jgi:hypothetical protein